MTEENQAWPVETPEPKPEIVETEVPQQERKKTKLHWIIYALLAGMILLYAIFFIFLWRNNSVQIPPAATINKQGGLKVAFVNSDSIFLNYMLVKDLNKKLAEKHDRLQNELKPRQTALQAKYEELQQKYSSRKITEEEANKLGMQLQKEDQMLNNLEQQYSDQIDNDRAKMNNTLIDSLDNFMARYNKRFQFDYILNFTRGGGGILFARDTLDITKYVLKELNDEYLKHNPK